MNTKVLKGMSLFLVVVMVALAVFSAALTLQADRIAAGTITPRPLTDGDDIAAGSVVPRPLTDGGDAVQAVAAGGIIPKP